MRVFRIERMRYCTDALRGIGSALSGGFRWNSLHTCMVYTSESRSLAMLEVCVHLNINQELPSDRYLMEIDIPGKLVIENHTPDSLPVGWNDLPPRKVSQQFGDDFIRRAETAVMRVPSCIVPNEFNFLINPTHPDARKIKVVESKPFSFDRRLRN